MTKEIDITEEQNPMSTFQDVVKCCHPGTRIIYYRGNAVAGSVLARQVRNSYAAGLVELVQRRIKGGRVGGFEYIAVRKALR